LAIVVATAEHKCPDHDRGNYDCPNQQIAWNCANGGWFNL
jgi:hypothetical protein